jgi:drug/metabolite transporter (DMT)-like permease
VSPLEKSSAGNRASSFWTLVAASGAVSAFSANSLLCREALRSGVIDPVSFSTFRLLSGAVALGILTRSRHALSRRPAKGSWASAVALFVYAAAFSIAYVELSAGTGALVLFAAVQLTMIGGGLVDGERIAPRTASGLALATSGLLLLLLPGTTAPSLPGASLMVLAGVAWGLYSLRGRAVVDPIQETASHFARAVPLSLALGIFLLSRSHITPRGVLLAVVSGAVTSGGGYVLWHAAVRRLSATKAAVVQLAVPVMAALGGVVALGEPAEPRLAVSGALVLGGASLVLSSRSRRPSGESSATTPIRHGSLPIG